MTLICYCYMENSLRMRVPSGAYDPMIHPPTPLTLTQVILTVETFMLLKLVCTPIAIPLL